jgi:hypothetical protein
MNRRDAWIIAIRGSAGRLMSGVSDAASRPAARDGFSGNFGRFLRLPDAAGQHGLGQERDSHDRGLWR